MNARPRRCRPSTAEPLALYRERYLRCFGAQALQGMRIGVYEHSSVARDLLHDLLRSLGAETLGLARSDAFVAIDTEAVREEDRALARQWSAAHGLDAIVTTDGDADRPLIADEQGRWLRGDTLGLLCARELHAGSVVTPVNSTTALEASGLFRRGEAHAHRFAACDRGDGRSRGITPSSASRPMAASCSEARRASTASPLRRWQRAMPCFPCCWS